MRAPRQIRTGDESRGSIHKSQIGEKLSGPGERVLGGFPWHYGVSIVNMVNVVQTATLSACTVTVGWSMLGRVTGNRRR